MPKEISSFSVSDVYKKENRRRRRAVFYLAAFVVYAVFLGGTWLVVRSPLFRVQNVEISGNKIISSENILALLNRGISNGSFWEKTLGAQNILAWPENLSPGDLRIVPELKGLLIRKDYGKRSIVIAVEERRPFAVWCSVELSNIPRISSNDSRMDVFENNSISFENDSRACWWFDNEGVLFAKALRVEGNLITVVHDYSQKNLGLGSDILPSEFVPNIFSVFKAISGGDFSIKEIRLNDINLQEVEVDTYSGPKLYFSLRFPADNTLAVIQSLKNQPGLDKLQYVDFRLENRAYYK